MKPWIWSLTLLGLLGCGAAALPPQEIESTEQFGNQAVWISDQGDQGSNVQFLEKINKINILPSTPPVRYVYGAYWVRIPDESNVTFRSSVEQGHGSLQSPVFQLYTQRGSEFSLLGQVQLDFQHETGLMEVDLTAYRGQEILLILSVSTEHEGAQLVDPVSWDHPEIIHP